MVHKYLGVHNLCEKLAYNRDNTSCHEYMRSLANFLRITSISTICPKSDPKWPFPVLRAQENGHWKKLSYNEEVIVETEDYFEAEDQ